MTQYAVSMDNRDVGSDSPVMLECRGHVASVWLNRPEQYNAMDSAMVGALTQAALRVDQDPHVEFVVVSGAGRHFSAGGRPNQALLGDTRTLEEHEAEAKAVSGMLSAWAGIGKPTVARVNGAALGAACGLVSVCDIVVASTDSSFSVADVRVGLLPSAVAPFLVSAIGARQAKRWCLTGERLYAVRAQALGLVHEVAAPEAVDEAITGILMALEQGGRQAQSGIKRLLDELAERGVDEVLIGDCAHRQAEQRLSAEGREGLAAFVERRPAHWAEPQLTI